jgi:hydroxymethylpyrimidine kinase/phosphomethylpyrimidine kinase
MRPFVISIAGFDPSSGAGVTADCKTMEACGAYGLGVCSAVTFQNETEFDGVEWIAVDAIIRQLDTLLRRYKVEYCKIGLIENFSTLKILVDYLNLKGIRIVWDPILKASAGFLFHSGLENETEAAKLRSLFSNVFLITPNHPEYEQLCLWLGESDLTQWLETGVHAVLLKGGHLVGNDCSDFLYTKNKIISVEGARIPGFDKHGTGCVLSAAIVARLALGDALPDACLFAKRYVERFIRSNDSLLGYHYVVD